MIVTLVGLALHFLSQRITETEKDRSPRLETYGNVLIRNGNLLTVTHGKMSGSDVLIIKGKIAQIGKHLIPPAGTLVYDATGMFVTPGIVDAHSHRAEVEDNEPSVSIDSEVRITDALDPYSDDLYTNLASGITTFLALHGSSNPIGGISAVVKSKRNRPVWELPISDAPGVIKFALGENVIRAQGNKDQRSRFPNSRIGVEAVFRRAFSAGKQYRDRWNSFNKNPSGEKPRRDLRLETLVRILDGKLTVHCHCYRQDEMLMMVRLSQEFGFKLVLQHALEAYKIAPELKAAGVPVSMFGDGFSYKVEAIDSMPQGPTLCLDAGLSVSINTDSSSGLVPLTQDAGKCLRYGLTEDQALRMVTITPAQQLGISQHVGSLDIGKDGDVAVWQGHPLSVYSKCQATFIEGEEFFERRDAFHVDANSVSAAQVVRRTYTPEHNVLPNRSNSYLVLGGDIFPVSSSPIYGGSLLVTDGKIKAIGRDVKAPKGATIVDAKGLNVYPGFIDSGATIGLIEVKPIVAMNDANEQGAIQPDLHSWVAVNPESVHFAKARMNGVTTAYIRNLTGAICGQGAVLNLSGSTVEDMMIRAHDGLQVTLPEKDADVMPIRAVFERARHVQGDQDVQLTEIRPFALGQKPVLFTADSAVRINQALDFAMALGLKPIISGGAQAWMVAARLAREKVPVILVPPAILCPDSSTRVEPTDPYDATSAVAAVLRREKVLIAFQSDSYDQPMNLPFAVGRSCAFGLSHEDAMRALTLDAATILGVADRIGSLEVGKQADIVVTDGDPLELSTQTRYLFIKGQPLPLKSKYTDLWAKYRTRIGRPLVGNAQR